MTDATNFDHEAKAIVNVSFVPHEGKKKEIACNFISRGGTGSVASVDHLKIATIPSHL
jgi:hypothetical protein